jgi:hypothetical protein
VGLTQGEQVGPQSGFLVGQAEFAAQVVPVDLDGLGRDAEHIGDFLCAFALHDEVNPIDFGGGQAREILRQIVSERREDGIQAFFQEPQVVLSLVFSLALWR